MQTDQDDHVGVVVDGGDSDDRGDAYVRGTFTLHFGNSKKTKI